ncbi:MAG: gamma-glutamyltransferase [Gemmatimonadaceae bacterium]
MSLPTSLPRCMRPIVALLASGFVPALVPSMARAQRDDPNGVASRTGLVVSSNNYASDIGAAVLARGGNAVDAAVATAFALAVTHPAAGNIGGGGFMVVRLASGVSTTFDFREKAPRASRSTMFLNANGTIAYSRTDSGWISPGVPGTVRGLALAHSKLGKLPWRAIVMPAAELAKRGFPLSKALAEELNTELTTGNLRYFPSSVRAYGKKGGGKWIAGDTLRLGDLARALAAIAEKGPNVFYAGWIADSLAAQMKAHGGLITRADLAAYQSRERTPVKGTFLGHEIIAMGPPSSGGIVMMETLNQLEHFGIEKMKRDSPQFLHLRIEAARRAYLDRARFVGDPDFVQVPVARLTSKAYGADLARSIDTARASSSLTLGRDVVATPTAEPNETTHFSVVDAQGNAVSQTYTLEGGYGSGIVVSGAGFILNNEMGDFNKKTGETNARGDIGTPPNLVAPGKRMLSSMSPVIVTKGGKLRLVAGSPGGRTIPNTVLDVVLGVTAFQMSVRAAVDAPRIHMQWFPDTTYYEEGLMSKATVALLTSKGHALKAVPARTQGDAHSILVDPATGAAWGANDHRSADSKASVPASEGKH